MKRSATKGFEQSCRKGRTVAVMLLALCATLLFLLPAQLLADQRPYLILYAFDEEGRLLAAQMKIEVSVRELGHAVQVGTLAGHSVVLAESGIGMTNAALTAQHLIDRHHPQGVIFSGIAGAIDSLVHIGDIVVCDRWVTHDYGYHGAEGLKPQPIAAYSPAGDSLADWLAFPVDSGYLRLAGGLKGDSLGLAGIGARRPSLRMGGTGVSGNTFIDNIDKRIWLSQAFGAQVVDMESAAVAQVCTVNQVPFLIFRSASDLAGGSGSATARTEINEFFKEAAENTSKVVIAFLQMLKQ